ncbi:MAG: DNA mismatch repair endonuclease MutL [Planctomycetes bacterium]|nr:DNA mismatch repair endonuclease MutL [Planctomycetota bacterium]
MAIKRLSQHVVDQIAAGEVVERPSSVVKELVENSLDAGARHVRVEVEGGGLVRLAILDDGDGIAPEELPLAVAAHATSKISGAEDLVAVRSYGFRGEALASIAAIAHLSIASQPRGGDIGALLVARGGVLEPLRPLARAPGTTIEVRDLFFNTPARRKFMKAESTELAHVTETVLRLALARLDVGFELWSHGRRSLVLDAGQTLVARVAAGFGRELADSLIEVSLTLPDLKLRGLLAPPDQARARTSLQHLWINGRFVRDRTVQGAVRSAYRDFLAESLVPVWFLFLELPPGDVDCNVHPTKVEVRLRRSDIVYKAVVAAVERTLRGADLAPRFRMGLRPTVWPTAPAMPAMPAMPLAPAEAASAEAVVLHDPAAAAGSVFEVLAEQQPGAPVVRIAAVGAGEAPRSLQPSLLTVPAAPRVLPGRFVQVLKTYVATACAEGLLLFDQHALHERVLYRHLREQWQAKAIRRQELLVPLTVELPAADVLALEEQTDLLETVGVRVAPLGRTSVGVSSLPAVAAPHDVAGLLVRLVALVRGERPEGRLDDFADRMLFTMACHRAVRAGDALGEEQIAGLLLEADRIEHAHTCPHGRPTRVVIPLAELENLFKRRGF